MNNTLYLTGLLALLFSLAPTSAYSQEWTVDGPPAGGLFYAVFNPHNPDQVYGVSEDIRPKKSSDGGFTWSDATDLFTPNITFSFTLLFHPTSEDTVYFSTDGVLRRSVDGMESWTTVADILEDGYYSNVLMSPSNPSRLYGITATNQSYGMELIRSDDGGTTWDMFRPDSAWTLVDIDPFNADRLIGLYDGDVVISTDGGESFHRMPGIMDHPVYEFEYVPPVQFDRERPDTLYVNDMNDIYLVSLAEPVTRTLIYTQSPTSYSWGLEVNAANHLQIVDEISQFQQIIVRSMNAGATWDTLGLGLPNSQITPFHEHKRLRAFARGIDSITYILSNELNSFVSWDGGQTVESTCYGLSGAQLENLMPLDPENGEFLTMTEDDQLWVGRTEQLWRCLMWERTEGFAYSPLAPDSFFFWDTTLYRTRSHGLLVEQIPAPDTTLNVDMVGVLASDPSVVFVRQLGQIYRSDDHGDSWTWLQGAMPVVEEIGPFASDTTHPDRIFTWSDRLQYSEDRGLTWETLGPNAQRPKKMVTEPWGWGVFGVGEFGDLWYQDQYGTFIDLTDNDQLPELTRIEDIAIRPHTMNDLYAALGYHGVWHTDDFGETWTQLDGVPEGECTSVAFNLHGTGLYVGHRDGLLYADGLFEQAGQNNTVISTLPQSVLLHPACPNPFNASTRIAYDLPLAGRVRVTVYDLLGRQVAVLANGFQQAGVRQVNWDGSGRSSGTYLVQLEADEIKQVQKIQLIK